MGKRKSVKKKFTSKQIVDGNSLTNEDFAATIIALKDDAAKAGEIISDSEIAQNIGLSESIFAQYLDQTEQVPEAVFSALREIYGKYLTYRIYKIVSFHSHPDPYTEMGPEDFDED